MAGIGYLAHVAGSASERIINQYEISIPFYVQLPFLSFVLRAFVLLVPFVLLVLLCFGALVLLAPLCFWRPCAFRALVLRCFHAFDAFIFA